MTVYFIKDFKQYEAGDSAEFSDDMAKALSRGGYVVKSEGHMRQFVKVEVPKIETASNEPEAETAMMPKAKRTRKSK